MLRSDFPFFNTERDDNFGLNVLSTKRIISFGPGLKDEVVCGNFPLANYLTPDACNGKELRNKREPKRNICVEHSPFPPLPGSHFCRFIDDFLPYSEDEERAEPISDHRAS